MLPNYVVICFGEYWCFLYFHTFITLMLGLKLALITHQMWVNCMVVARVLLWY